ncbi:hypothetical protein BHE74_00042791 [Ensete ventricosum]|nr:hypothetical protein BHE74_00042791 [Ensete ventricosum]RZR94828.1 hypothetical protein BHM03_00023585 [Ensete ventricosum]
MLSTPWFVVVPASPFADLSWSPSRVDFLGWEVRLSSTFSYSNGPKRINSPLLNCLYVGTLRRKKGNIGSDLGLEGYSIWLLLGSTTEVKEDYDGSVLGLKGSPRVVSYSSKRGDGSATTRGGYNRLQRRW